MTPFDQYEVARIRAEVIRLQLDGWERIAALPFEELCAEYNGTGPAILPQSAREKLDEIAAPFLPAVMIHDDDFTRSDGSVSGFTAANRRLLSNCISCALNAAPWNSWRRYVLIAEAWTIYRACDKFGWAAWLSAYYENKGKIK